MNERRNEWKWKARSQHWRYFISVGIIYHWYATSLWLQLHLNKSLSSEMLTFIRKLNRFDHRHKGDKPHLLEVQLGDGGIFMTIRKYSNEIEFPTNEMSFIFHLFTAFRDSFSKFKKKFPKMYFNNEGKNTWLFEIQQTDSVWKSDQKMPWPI